MCTNLGVVGNQDIAQVRADYFVHQQPQFCRQRPLGALPFDAVHIHVDLTFCQPLQHVENRGVIAEH